MHNLQQVLHQLGQNRVFLARGRKSYEQCGAKAILDDIFKKEAISVTEFMDISVNPHYDEAVDGVRRLKESGAHIIIATGGGSVMDTAKLIRHLAAEEGYYALLLAIPTTAGTGAEVTRYSIVCRDGIKQSLQAEDMLPDYAFVYAPYIYGVSGYLAACTGFDALAHALESYWSRSANSESRAIALRAIELLWRNLPTLVKSPTPEICDAVAEGSFLAGRAINITKTTAPHAFSYAFTMQGNYPHGHAVALTFPYFFGLNLSANDPLVERLALAKNVPFETQMRDYILGIGLGYTGCGDEALANVLSQVNMQKLQNNPVEMDEARMAQLKISVENCKI